MQLIAVQRGRCIPCCQAARLALGVFLLCLSSGSRTFGNVPEPASPQNLPRLQLVPSSMLGLDGDSTLHRYSVKAEGLSATFKLGPATVIAQATGSGVESLVRQGEIRSVELVIPVEQLTSGNAGLDKNLRNALLGGQYKYILFRATPYEMSEPTPPGAPFGLSLHGKLSIAGVEHDIQVAVQCTALGDQLRITGSQEILMSDYKVQPPGYLFGLLKAKDLVTIQFNLMIQKSAP